MIAHILFCRVLKCQSMRAPMQDVPAITPMLDMYHKISIHGPVDWIA